MICTSAAQNDCAVKTLISVFMKRCALIQNRLLVIQDGQDAVCKQLYCARLIS